MHIIFTGGGSGGHVVPNIAIIERLRALDSRMNILYIGSRDGIERRITESIPVPYCAIATGKLRRYFSWQTPLDIGNVCIGIVQSIITLHRHRADVVFSKGGYVSLPVTLAAWILRIPVVIHESDIHPGFANRIAAHFAKIVCVASEKTQKYFPKAQTIVTGIPIRSDLDHGNPERARSMTSLHENIPTILFVGGGNGDPFINELASSMQSQLVKNFQIIHLLGSETLSSALSSHRYTASPFADAMNDLYALADVVITRAGATTLAELAHLGKHAILIPMPRGCSRGEQIENAKIFANSHQASTLQESECTPDALVAAIAMMHSTTPTPPEQNIAAHTIATLLLSYEHPPR